jgi:peptidoglycan/LPS O-acetylase OafA/YrhL
VIAGAHVNVPHIGIAVALHLALIHNLSFATTEYLNGPLWSIALECQIYVVFALLLIPVWRRFGAAAQLALALLLGFLPHILTHSFDWTVPWLVALFALGVVAADLCARRTLPRLPWNLLTIIAAVVAVAVLVPYVDGELDWYLWPADLIVGVMVALFFVASHRDDRIVPARLLGARPIVFLGTFSYSLYLIHAPIVDVAGALLYRVHASAALSVAVWAALIPAILAAAYGFYRVFERPFLTAGFRRAIDADVNRPAAAPHPAILAVEPAA